MLTPFYLGNDKAIQTIKKDNGKITKIGWKINNQHTKIENTLLDTLGPLVFVLDFGLKKTL